MDNIEAAQRVFVEQLGATIEVIAKDVKLQVAFDKNKVARYRLLGFENRMLDKRDFANDRVDAGEIGGGHTATAIYEIKLRNSGGSGDLGVLRVRYKEPAAQTSRLIEKACRWRSCETRTPKPRPRLRSSRSGNSRWTHGAGW